MKMAELLAPAGNMEMLKAAVENGADAVYMGLRNFNARAMSANFTLEEYIEAIKYAHLRNVKVYLTLNTLIYDEELPEALNDLITLYENGLDACIVQDLGLALNIKKVLPDLPLHASTQMTIHNIKQLKLLEKLGYKRAVLARELTIEEIREICKNTTLEIEVFVHGALCVSVSGQCLLSSAIGQRSGNRGSCAQPCRTSYSLYKKPEKCIVERAYILSKKDIYGLDNIQEIIDAGVKSLKIEGRNKGPAYVATCISKYRKYIDEKLEVTKEDEEELLQIFSRSGKSYGYLKGVPFKEGITPETPKNTGIFLGKVLEQKKEYVKVKLETGIDLHDGIEVYSKGQAKSTIVTCIRGERFKILNEKVPAGEIAWLGDINERVEIGSNIYKTSSDELNKKLSETWTRANHFSKKNLLTAKVEIVRGKNITLQIEDSYKRCAKYEMPYEVKDAKSKPATKADIISSLSKTNNTPFAFSSIEVTLDSGIFVPVSCINELRRETINMLMEKYNIKREITEARNTLKEIVKEKTKYLECGSAPKTVENSTYMYTYKEDLLEDKNANIYIQVEDYAAHKKSILEKISKEKIYICIPNIVLKNTAKYIEDNLEEIATKVGGFVIGNIGYIEDCIALKSKNKDLKLVADYSLNITNTYTARYYTDLGIDKVAVMTDLPESQLNILDTRFNLEKISGYLTVMTSRYCILGSYINQNAACTAPCKDGQYYLVDAKGIKLPLVCKRLDCIMKVLKEIPLSKDKDTKTSVRNCTL
ncbi:MAG: U32 family peptidase [Clostridia bacterium]